MFCRCYQLAILIKIKIFYYTMKKLTRFIPLQSPNSIVDTIWRFQWCCVLAMLLYLFRDILIIPSILAFWCIHQARSGAFCVMTPKHLHPKTTEKEQKNKIKQEHNNMNEKNLTRLSEPQMQLNSENNHFIFCKMLGAQVCEVNTLELPLYKVCSTTYFRTRVLSAHRKEMALNWKNG